jgi:hypothetical protein
MLDHTCFSIVAAIFFSCVYFFGEVLIAKWWVDDFYHQMFVKFVVLFN